MSLCEKFVGIISDWETHFSDYARSSHISKIKTKTQPELVSNPKVANSGYHIWRQFLSFSMSLREKFVGIISDWEARFSDDARSSQIPKIKDMCYVWGKCTKN